MRFNRRPRAVLWARRAVNGIHLFRGKHVYMFDVCWQWTACWLTEVVSGSRHPSRSFFFSCFHRRINNFHQLCNYMVSKLVDSSWMLWWPLKWFCPPCMAIPPDPGPFGLFRSDWEASWRQQSGPLHGFRAGIGDERTPGGVIWVIVILIIADIWQFSW